MTRIDLSDARAKDDMKHVVERACKALHMAGYVIFINIFSVEVVQRLKTQLDITHTRVLSGHKSKEMVRVGDKRIMAPVAFTGEFARPDVWAHPVMLQTARSMLGDDATLESFGAVISLPGAQEQHRHRDGQMLFESEISCLLPAHALTFVIPLVEMNEVNGSTALWTASHRRADANASSETHVPVIPLGSCAMWDYRLFHAGTPNRSESHRPIVYGTYARRWYRDAYNFTRQEQKRLEFGDDFLHELPADLRRLFYLARN